MEKAISVVGLVMSLAVAVTSGDAGELSTAAPAAAADIDFHYLAADPSLRAKMENASVVMGKATYVGQVLSLDEPWESPYLLGYPGSVVTDPVTGQWRMYYELMKTEEERFVGMATSQDGVHWVKPKLNITGTKYTTDPSNNFINGAQTWVNNPSVFVDPRAPADQRYRMVERCRLPNTKNDVLYASASADGLNWRRVGTIDDAPTVEEKLDSQNTAFWDPRTGQYIAEMRWWYPATADQPPRRGVFTKRSDTFDTTWSGPREFTIDPINTSGIGPGPSQPDIYCSSIVPYRGQYIGLPSMYYHPAGLHGNGPIYPTFMYSRDSVSWTFPDVNHPSIDLAAHGGSDPNTFGMAFAMTSLPERDGKLYIYYSYTPSRHHEAKCVPYTMHLATIGEDRFVGIKAASGPIGTWTTSAITLPDNPGELIVNAVVGDSLRVEVLDPETLAPLAGYSKDDGVSIAPGDYLNAVARWNGAGDLRGLAGRTIALRFEMNDATIYSFRFQSLSK